ncbi:hypothetical protein ACFFX0_13105 [Citricoccus parietis]|uniref:Uncharacterized protein n=1 Tax=Citricoccus parietis TaxID=592307 RepID=A0ABV5FZJ6_9MICC
MFSRSVDREQGHGDGALVAAGLRVHGKLELQVCTQLGGAEAVLGVGRSEGGRGSQALATGELGLNPLADRGAVGGLDQVR